MAAAAGSSGASNTGSAASTVATFQSLMDAACGGKPIRASGTAAAFPS